MEIYDEEDLTPFELQRQKNIIRNYEFMKSCGLHVKPLVYVKKKIVPVEEQFKYVSDERSSDSNDEDWNLTAKQKKKESDKRFSGNPGDIRKKVRNPSTFFSRKVKESNHEKKKKTYGNEGNQFIRKRPKRVSEGSSSPSVVSTAECEQRKNPKRGARVNYEEADVPDDDHYLFCEECAEFYYGDCPMHGSLLPYGDNTVSESDSKLSTASLPDGLEIKESCIKGAGLGVFANQSFSVGTTFGPYLGKKVRPDFPRDEIDTSYMWEIMKDGKIAYYINGKDEEYGNWMRYINCSRAEEEQNLLAFQYHSEIYYRVYKDINPGDECLVWYGEEYAKDLGIDLEEDEEKESVELLGRKVEKERSVSFTVYKCDNCILGFTSADRLFRHKKYCRGNKRNNSSKFLPNEKPQVKVLNISENPTARFLMTQLPTNQNGNCHLEVMQSSVQSNFSTVSNTNIDASLSVKRFGCDVCGKQFNRSNDLKMHMRIHTGETPYKCEVCGKQSNQSGHLKTHMRIHTGETPYKCEVCGKQFNVSGHLKGHMRIHTGETPFKCEVCGKQFNQSGHLKTHMRIHTGETPYKCEVCGKQFNVSGHLKGHMRIHTGETPFKCEVCGKQFNVNCNLKKHMRIHTGETPYKCEVCGKQFKVSSHLKEHIRIHTGETPYKCEVCGKQFNQSGDLKKHMRIHTGETPYKCEVCGKQFNQSGDLKRHMRIHTGETPYKCEVCGKQFNQSGSLKKHMRIHTGETPYKCDVCGKQFNENGSLKNHMRIHTGETPYKCEVCGKQFNVSGHLKKHMRIHTGETPYKCDVCGKQFNQSGSLKNHMRIHTGETPYKCDVCGKQFNENGSLKNHMRIHTGETPYKCEVCGKQFSDNSACKRHMRAHGNTSKELGGSEAVS